MMKPTNAVQGLASGAAAVTMALTATAFWLSYEHLHDVAADNGLAGARAWAWPGTVDMFIVAGELLILRAALRGRFDGFAYLLAGVGSLGSIALNVAGVGWGASPLEYVVAAVPPVAALLAFAAVMRQVHERLAGHAERPEVTTAATIERADAVSAMADVEPLGVATPAVIELPAASPLWDEFLTTDMANKVTAAVPAETPRQVVTEVVTRTPADLRRDARKLHKQVVTLGGRGVTIDQLRDAFDLSRREATELRREVVGGVRS
ncbi:DUF2637 domain-containing protein [Streptomyces sp. NBC_00236]|uniref:DUF2637 domain-containing protein n=1 Tax=Streptomyces sp. NBC_00236 TaxID=2903639 RepID=UPI002E2B622E|nr:DUF2637 domain-containing protein [Streptomyces sp. NBC_00236]